MSEANRIPEDTTLLVGEEVEASVSEALARVDEAIGLLGKCPEWNKQTGLLDDAKVLRDRLGALLKVMEACRQRIDASK